jgi:alpha-tubulin suppressor-like RCC1 family protein
LVCKLKFFFQIFFNFFFLESGIVYSFGWNGWGSLGIGSTKNMDKPEKLEFEKNEKIKNIFTFCNCLGAFFYSSFLIFYFYFKFILKFFRK